MTSHPTLVEVLKTIMSDKNLSQNKVSELTGVSYGTLKKFLDGEVVQDGTMRKIRAFPENPDDAGKKQSKPAKKSTSKAGEVAMSDIEFLMMAEKSDIEFVIGVMNAMGQESLSVDKMKELIKLKKRSEPEE